MATFGELNNIKLLYLQHLTVLTSTPNLLHDSLHSWQTNGVGFKFNHLFGFGVLNAEYMVNFFCKYN